MAIALASFFPAVGIHAADASVPDYEKALKVSQAVIGKKVGNHVLRDRNRREVRLSEFRGKPLLVNFVYTSCSQVCPTTTQFLAKSARLARSALGEESFRIVTIGFNLPFDSPEAMAAFARQNSIDLAGWEFLSPERDAVEALTADFGFSFNATPKGFDHISQVTIVDRDGVVYRQIYGDSFDLPLLVGPLKELLSGQATRSGGLEGLWTQVKLYCTVYDPGSGGYRLNYSLFVEIFAGMTVLIGIGWFYFSSRRIGRKRQQPS